MTAAHAPTRIASRLAQGGILAGAVQVFGKVGFAKARVEDILEAAKVARRTFYKHFQSKEDVLAAVYEVATGELLGAVRAQAEERGGARPLRAIKDALDVYLDYHVENAALVRVLVEQAMRSDSPLAPLRRRFRADLVRLIGDAVEAETGKRHDALLYLGLLSALEGVSLEILASGAKKADVDRARKTMHQLLDRALA
jgi:AcrR family transcriptional regulator